ncbi:MAG: O-GlcNAc transferase [Phycisphaerae bacterium]|nr:MAG: tetratricopeptide repeat protein [Planctomycetia bacterium]RIK71110.1 MAG: O-GlcNAc transferase [Planctomycetota bacterium]GJQ27441.1 MAG: O-GlcNAc transferase [Phycisphaerae bacterium]
MAKHDTAPPLAPSPWFAGPLLVALVFVAYLPAISAGFIWDDDHYVTQNPVLRTQDGLNRIWFDLGATPQYYPLVHTSFWIEYRLYRLNPIGYHAVNILLHAANAVVLWQLLRRLHLRGAWLAATLFALHPISVESVAWVTERKNVLSAFFYLTAAIVYIRWMQRRGDLDVGTPPSPPQTATASRATGRKTYLLALALFVCALLSKTVTASLPAAILLIAWWKTGRLTRRQVLPTLPMFALAIAAAALTAWMERSEVGAEGADWNFSIADRFLIAGRACWFYLAKLLWPHPLVFIYPRWTIDDSQWWQYAFPVAAVALIATLFVLRHRIGRGPLTAALFFGGTLFPALGFFNVYPMRFSFVADHFQYLAAIGPLTLIAAAIPRIFSRRQDQDRANVSTLSLAVIAILTTLGTLTFRQARIYRDIETLWRHTLAHNPDCWMAHGNLAKTLAERGDTATALDHARRVLDARPDLPSSHTNYGDILSIARRPAEAIPYYQRALEINPRHLKAHFGLADALMALNRPADAVPHYQSVLEARPDFPTCLRRIGAAYEAAGRYADALTSYTRALELQPQSAETLYGIGRANFFMNNLTVAGEFFRRTIAVKPDHAEACNDLATVLAALGNDADALKCLDRAIQINPDYVVARFNRALLLEGLGRAADAAAELQSVLRLQPDHAEAAERLARLRTVGSPTPTSAPMPRP